MLGQTLAKLATLIDTARTRAVFVYYFFFNTAVGGWFDRKLEVDIDF